MECSGNTHELKTLDMSPLVIPDDGVFFTTPLAQTTTRRDGCITDHYLVVEMHSRETIGYNKFNMHIHSLTKTPSGTLSHTLHPVYQKPSSLARGYEHGNVWVDDNKCKAHLPQVWTGQNVGHDFMTRQMDVDTEDVMVVLFVGGMREVNNGGKEPMRYGFFVWSFAMDHNSQWVVHVHKEKSRTREETEVAVNDTREYFVQQPFDMPSSPSFLECMQEAIMSGTIPMDTATDVLLNCFSTTIRRETNNTLWDVCLNHQTNTFFTMKDILFIEMTHNMYIQAKITFSGVAQLHILILCKPLRNLLTPITFDNKHIINKHIRYTEDDSHALLKLRQQISLYGNNFLWIGCGANKRLFRINGKPGDFNQIISPANPHFNIDLTDFTPLLKGSGVIQRLPVYRFIAPHFGEANNAWHGMYSMRVTNTAPTRCTIELTVWGEKRGNFHVGENDLYVYNVAYVLNEHFFEQYYNTERTSTYSSFFVFPEVSNLLKYSCQSLNNSTKDMIRSAGCYSIIRKKYSHTHGVSHNALVKEITNLIRPTVERLKNTCTETILAPACSYVRDGSLECIITKHKNNVPKNHEEQHIEVSLLHCHSGTNTIQEYRCEQPYFIVSSTCRKYAQGEVSFLYYPVRSFISGTNDSRNTVYTRTDRHEFSDNGWYGPK